MGFASDDSNLYNTSGFIHGKCMLSIPLNYLWSLWSGPETDFFSCMMIVPLRSFPVVLAIKMSTFEYIFIQSFMLFLEHS